MGNAQKTRLVILVLMLMETMLFLQGCSPKLTEGVIYEKEFKPAYSTTTMMTQVHSNGRSVYTTLIPVINHYPDRWCIRIRSLNSDKNGEFETAEYYVTQSVYDSCEVGDMFSYDKDRDFSEEPVYREK